MHKNLYQILDGSLIFENIKWIKNLPKYPKEKVTEPIFFFV